MTRWRRPGALLLAVTLLAGVVAAANALDTLWVPGAYDGGDYDDAVTTIASPVTPPDPVLRPAAPRLPSAPLPEAASASLAPGGHPRTALEVRAPPLA